MPQITDYKTPKKFQKKEYRPWNILEEIKKENSTLKLVANYEQTSSETDSKLVAIQRLSGVQKNVFLFLINRQIEGSIVVTTEELKQGINSHIETTRNAILRLINKGLIIRGKSKEGRGGFLVLIIPKKVKNEFEKHFLNQEKVDSKLVANYEQTSSNSPSVSSSIYINKTTTTISDSVREIVDNFSFPNEWEEIDIEPLAFIKFTKAHLDQIYKAGKISPDMLQTSIHSFAFDLQVNDKAKSLKLSPINVFMGMMKKGNPYLPPENYESPEEQVMKAYNEAMKKKAERVRKLEEECKALSLQEWRDGLSEDEQKAIVPEKYHAESERKIFDSLIFSHFEKEVWQSIKPNRKTSTLAI